MQAAPVLCSLLLGGPTPVNGKRGAGNVRGLVRSQEQRGVGHFARITDPAKDGIVTLPFVVRGAGFCGNARLDGSRAERVDPDIVRAVIVSRAERIAEERRLGGSV